MNYIKWLLGLVLLLVVIGFFHYTLPGRDIVQIVGTDVTLSQKGISKRTGTLSDSLDLRFINAIDANEEVHVYRNEDTDWSWPPYFKFDSSNITAQAQAFAKKEGSWVAITHYGWRIELFSVFPNAVRIKAVDGPDATLIPWFNIIFFIVLAIFLIFVARAILRFKRRTIDPVIDNFEDMVDDMGDSAEQAQNQALEAKNNLLDWIKSFFKR